VITQQEGLQVKTILVLEDESAVMRLFRRVLDGYTILEATTAEEARQRFIENGRHLDLLIADVILPKSSGIHTALLLREASSQLRIVLTSGYPRSMWSDQDAIDLRQLGSDSVVFLQKPFLPTTLLKTVHSCIGRPVSWATAVAG
jgi:two-component system, cell cycle sensor histidine kinase and response regulator CckA